MTEVVYTQAYNKSDYNPSMPVLDIGVSRPGATSPAVSLEVIVDTGADSSLFPVEVLQKIGARIIDRAMLAGITGHRQRVDLYVVTLHMKDVRIHGVKVAALPRGAPGVLGRDVLNQLSICLNGPAGVIEVAL